MDDLIQGTTHTVRAFILNIGGWLVSETHQLPPLHTPSLA